MKQRIKTGIAALALSLISICSFAQQVQPANTVNEANKGYWVLESNVHAPLNHIIRFYNDDNMLIYTETITGTRINPKKAKVKKKLNKALASALMAWEKNKVPEENKAYVVAFFR